MKHEIYIRMVLCIRYRGTEKTLGRNELLISALRAVLSPKQGKRQSLFLISMGARMLSISNYDISTASSMTIKSFRIFFRIAKIQIKKQMLLALGEAASSEGCSPLYLRRTQTISEKWYIVLYRLTLR